MTTTLRRLLVILATVAVVAACSEHQPTVTSVPAAVSSSTTSTGVLQGHLYGVGGPAPGRPQAWPGTVTITGPTGRQDITVGADGAYSVTLAAGRYGVVGHSPRYGNGTYLCRAPGDARVTAGTTTTLDTYCSMR